RRCTFCARRATARMPRNPRRVYDRAFVLARCRWECLRRRIDYRADVRAAIDKGARSFKKKPGAFETYCLNDGGIIEPPRGKNARKKYTAVCRRYGLRWLIHYDLTLSVDEMVAYPIFTDTPHRQPTVKNQKLLRRIAVSRMELSRRMRRRIFSTH